MEREPIAVTLTPRAAELLEAVRDRHPERSTTEILEIALAESITREEAPAVPRLRTSAEVRAWLDELAALSDKISPRPGETFSRTMFYEEHG